MQEPTLPQQIANQLRRKILLGEFLPGSTVKERDNAAALGVSRTPMREAIRILSQEGLLVLRPSRSPIVADPSLKEITDAVTVMAALEVLSGELACRYATDDDIRRIMDLHDNLVETYSTGEPIDAFEIDMEIHRAIAAASSNPALAKTHHAYLARLWRVRYLSASLSSDRERSLRQHREIARGLELRDTEAVSREIRSHMEHLIANITQLCESRSAVHVSQEISASQAQ